MLETISGANPASAFVGMFQDPANRFFTLYLAASLGIACIVFYFEARHDPELKKAGLLRYLFPKQVYTHRSAIADYWFFVVNKLLFALAFGALIAVTSYSVEATSAVLRGIAVSPELPVPSWVAVLIATLASALAMDFGLWFGHWLLHKVPVLWEFHKVHHSAEVLTPLTAGRVHPLEDAINILFSGALGGVALALCRFLLGPRAVVFSPLQLNVLVVIFFFSAFIYATRISGCPIRAFGGSFSSRRHITSCTIRSPSVIGTGIWASSSPFGIGCSARSTRSISARRSRSA